LKVENIKTLMRPFIAVSFVLTSVALVSFGKIEAKDFMSITAIIVAFYFGERSALKNPNEKEPQRIPEA
jgi:hypothetical protein